MGVILGPALSNAHPRTTMFWLCFALSQTSGSHSGYPWLGCHEHDVHHEKFNYNFGVVGICDYLFNTDYDICQKQKAQREKQEADKQLEDEINHKLQTKLLNLKLKNLEDESGTKFAGH